MAALTDDELRALAADVVRREGEAVAGLAAQLPPTFPAIVRLLLACRGHVLVSGSGTSHAVALRFAHLLSCVGTPALFLHPGDSQHGSSGAVRRDDVWIGLSKGGETSEVIAVADIARGRGATTVAITEDPASTLAQRVDHVLIVEAPDDVDPYGMMAMGSSLYNAACCDAICVALLELRGYTLEDFGATHPGGAVGRRLRTARG